MISATDQDKIISLTEILDCPIDRAFQYFTDRRLLMQWLTQEAHVELKEGGAYELFWTPEDPDKTNNSTYGCKVLAFDWPHYLNVEWRGNADHKSFMNNVRPLTNVSIMFWQLDSGTTKITLLHTGWRQEEEWEQARQFFAKAWAGAFGKLKELTG